MNIIKHVPLSPALRAAAEKVAHTQSPDPTNREFSEWFNTSRLDLNGRSILGCVSVPLQVALTALDDVPATPAGIAWCDAVRTCITRTEADRVRPFDEVVFDTDDERAALAEQVAYADTLREASPLLEEVADVVEDLAPSGIITVGDLLTQRARVGDEGLNLRRPGENWCDKHEDYCYGSHEPRLARWEHLEAIAPGVEATIRGFIVALDAGLSEVASSDNGAARGVTVRD